MLQYAKFTKGQTMTITLHNADNEVLETLQTLQSKKHDLQIIKEPLDYLEAKEDLERTLKEYESGEAVLYTLEEVRERTSKYLEKLAKQNP